MEAEFESFKSDFLLWANRQLYVWAVEEDVSKPSVWIVPDERLDPWEPGAFYVTPKQVHSEIKGPAILFPEHYLKFLYWKAVERDRIAELWNSLYWTLGHEMGHHLRWFKRVDEILAYTTVPIREVFRRMEIGSTIRAYRLTGKTRQEHSLDFLKVTGLHPDRYKVKAISRRRLTWVKG